MGWEYAAYEKKGKRFTGNKQEVGKKSSRKNSSRIHEYTEYKPEYLVLSKIAPKKTSPIRLSFMYHPEYVTIGQKVYINDQRIKAIGTVTQTFKMEIPS